MLKFLSTTALLVTLTLHSPVFAGDEAASSKAIVTTFYETAFVRHQPAAAAAYLGDRYIQHNPRVPNGSAAFAGHFEQYFKEYPQASSTIYRVIAEGDLVVIHSWARKGPEDAGLAIVDIFRVADGKIVEHWDVMQPVVTETANGNTMFDGDRAD